MKLQVRNVVLGLMLAVIIAACTGDAETEMVRFRRFDKTLFSLDRSNPDLSQLESCDMTFLSLYADGVLRLGRPGQPNFNHYLSLFLSDTTIREIADSVFVHYPSMESQERDLSKACALVRKYFSKMRIPNFYTHISGFNQSVIVDTAVLSVSLDAYLGENCPFYKMLAVPEPSYMRRYMTEDNIVRDIMYGWMSSEFVYRPKQNDLVSGMIYQGKLMYLLELLLPDYTKERRFKFTEAQMQWCEGNEGAMWNFVIENGYLFDSSQMIFRKYLNDAPFSSGMPSASPGRAIYWNGYQIIRAYEEKTDCTLDELMSEQDYHKIMRISSYHPGN